MTVSDELKKNVAEKNIPAIRDDLWGCIAFDPNFTTKCKDCLDYCQQNGITDDLLYAEHDGRELNDEISEENFDKLCGQLRTNFSKERLEKIKEIGRKLYPVKEEKPVSQNPYKSTETHRQTTASSSSGESGDSGLLLAVGAGILIGAIGGGILGGLLFKKALIGAIAGAAIGAGAGAKLSRK